MFRMTDTESFQIAYDGVALREHRIDVRDLAPALMGLAELVEMAGKIVAGREAKTTLNVRATGEGSFLIDLEVVQVLNAIEKVTGFFAGDTYEGAKNLLELLGITVGGAISVKKVMGLLKLKSWLRGRTIEKVETIPAPPGTNPAFEYKRVTTQDGETTETFSGTLQLMQSPQAAAAVERMLKPLERPGIDTFAAGLKLTPGDLGSADVVIQEPEVPYFSIVPDDYKETLIDHTAPMAVTIVQSAFRDDLMWKVTDGNSTYHVRMNDATFVDNLRAGRVSLNAKDVLRVEMRTHQYRTKGAALRVEYEIERVIEHIPPREEAQFGLFPEGP